MSSADLPAADPSDASVTPELSDAELRRLERLKQDIKEKFPGFFPILRELIEVGWICGLRDIDYFGPPRPEPRNALSAGQMALNEYRPGDEPADVPLVRTRYK